MALYDTDILNTTDIGSMLQNKTENKQHILILLFTTSNTTLAHSLNRAN